MLHFRNLAMHLINGREVLGWDDRHPWSTRMMLKIHSRFIPFSGSTTVPGTSITHDCGVDTLHFSTVHIYPLLPRVTPLLLQLVNDRALATGTGTVHT
jgi:hypothetical protein